MNKQLHLMLSADGFDTFSGMDAARAKRAGAPHYYISKDDYNSRLYVPENRADVFAAVGDVVTVGYSSTSGSVVIAPRDAGLSKPRVVGCQKGARRVYLGPYHDALIARYGAGNVPVDLEQATIAGVPVVIARPKVNPCGTA